MVNAGVGYIGMPHAQILCNLFWHECSMELQLLQNQALCPLTHAVTANVATSWPTNGWSLLAVVPCHGA